MKLWKIIPMLMAVLMLAGCGGAQTSEKATGKPMTIYPTEFSAETKKVLDILDDEVMFFTYVTDETVKSYDLALWIYEDGVWTDASLLGVDYAKTEQNIVLRVKDTEIDVIQVSDTGNSKYTLPITQDFSTSQMAVEERLQNTASIELEKEIVLYYKVATDETIIRSETDFREIPCSAGIALTVTFSENSPK